MAFAAHRTRVRASASSSSSLVSACAFDFAFDVPSSTLSADEADAWFAAPHPLLSAATSSVTTGTHTERSAPTGARRCGVKRKSDVALQSARQGGGRVVTGEENASATSYARRRKRRAALTSDAIDEIADLVAEDGVAAAPALAAPPSTVTHVAAGAAPCRAGRRKSRRLSGGEFIL